MRSVATGRHRAFVDIALNVVDVRDVAAGHALALEHGRAGERYILGGVDLTLEQLFAAIARLAGRRPPRIRGRQAAVRAAALLGLVNRDEARLARLPAYFSSEKAERELGTGAARSSRRSRGRSRRRSVPAVAEPAAELAQSDHAREDQADDEHRLDDLLALLGGSLRERDEHSERHRRSTLPDSPRVGRERVRNRSGVGARLAAAERGRGRGPGLSVSGQAVGAELSTA